MVKKVPGSHINPITTVTKYVVRGMCRSTVTYPALRLRFSTTQNRNNYKKITVQKMFLLDSFKVFTQHSSKLEIERRFFSILFCRPHMQSTCQSGACSKYFGVWILGFGMGLLLRRPKPKTHQNCLGFGFGVLA